MDTKKRLAWLDIARGVAIVAMVFGHTLDTSSIGRRVIFSFHMPLFFIVSGCTLNIQREPGEFIKRAAQRLIIPYIAAFFITSIVDFSIAPTTQTLLILFQKIVFASFGRIGGHDYPAAGNIWFLPTLFISQVLVYLILRTYKGNMSRSGVVSFVLGVLGVTISQLAGLWLPFAFDVALVGVAYVWLGHALMQWRIGESKASVRALIFAVCLIIWISAISRGKLGLAVRDYSPTALSLVGGACGSLCVIIVATYLEDRRLGQVFSIIKWFGHNSMGVYMSHYLDHYIAWGGMPLGLSIPHGLYLVGLFRLTFDAMLPVLYNLCGFASIDHPNSRKQKHKTNNTTSA